jgi:hypothetical protein
MVAVFAVFSIVFTEGATEYIASHGPDADIVGYFNGVLVTMSTLFMAVTGGIDWEPAARALSKLSGIYVVAFYAFVAFAVFVMLNVASAIFIDNTVQRSKNDRDFIVHQELSGRQHFMKKMDAIFEDLARGGDKINLEEFTTYIEKPQNNVYLQSIDLNIYKVKKLFELMDVDKNGHIDRKEFIDGCDRLRGKAKELDLAILQHEVSCMGRKMLDQALEIRKLICSLGEHIDDTLDRIRGGSEDLH